MRTGKIAPTVQDLGAFLLQRGLAKYKLPERIETIDAFPVTRVGKVDKAALRARVTVALEAENHGSESQPRSLILVARQDDVRYPVRPMGSRLPTSLP